MPPTLWGCEYVYPTGGLESRFFPKEEKSIYETAFSGQKRGVETGIQGDFFSNCLTTYPNP